MTGFSGSPRLLKGAIVAFEADSPSTNVIVFQYNPNTITRTLQAQAPDSASGNRSEALRLGGAPIETINIDVEIDATDQLEKNGEVAAEHGIMPQLAALEMLLYPQASQVVTNSALAALGMLEIIPTESAFTLLVWGRKRILPVRLTEFSVTEDAHDTGLNALRATVSLGLRVLSYSDFPVSHPGYHVFLAHQIAKEGLGALGTIHNLDAVIGGEADLL